MCAEEQWRGYQNLRNMVSFWGGGGEGFENEEASRDSWGAGGVLTLHLGDGYLMWVFVL